MLFHRSNADSAVQLLLLSLFIILPGIVIRKLHQPWFYIYFQITSESF